jgi:hypothetical protein
MKKSEFLETVIRNALLQEAITSKFNYSNIEQYTGVSRHTIKKYLGSPAEARKLYEQTQQKTSLKAEIKSNYEISYKIGEIR